MDPDGTHPPIEVSGARTAGVEGPRQWLELRGNPAAVFAQVTARYPIADIALRQPDIEQVVRRISPDQRH
ncbi:hypothetical protein GCM10027570_07310 [Streptomonospora sediminis]